MSKKTFVLMISCCLRVITFNDIKTKEADALPSVRLFAPYFIWW